MMDKAHYDRVVHPTTCAPDDFWGQVRRTVQGKPIPQEQIDIIYLMVRQALQFQRNDILLDIACGNGRLGSEFFLEVQGYHGIDISPSLIDIAKSNFESLPHFSFEEIDATSYCTQEINPQRFTKVLFFGAFSYLPEAEALSVLSLLRTRFTSLKAVFIAPIPDKDCADTFFYTPGENRQLDDHTTAIGRWFAQADFLHLAHESGWNVVFPTLPEIFYQKHYRFNALLTPR